ncbi:tetratricopeptide repeat protein [Erythrobacter sp. WH131]|uniref:Tetratricopeptide repeat protein n=2 Tax=Erythrobacter ani TaxID=2827235 RepID=A0ABS6SKN6_9SPHN|nr:tetratricopeptide repeat protein [Erythrobacter ani]
MAQDNVSESRLRKIEAEIRALQRNVFPGGDGRYFEPQISSEQGAGNQSSPNAPSTTAVTDILARLDAMESQLQRLTALSEENTNSITQMESRLALLEASPAAGASIAETVDTEELPSTETNLSAMTGGSSSLANTVGTQTSAEPEEVGPSDERLAAVQQIAKPQTDDAADDEYSYGFRLWNAGFYPEARQQLSSFVDQYPDHWRVTYGRNLLGRAFLDDGMAEEAARWFLRNYQADRTAPRAPDSLLYLAQAMIAMEDTRRACIALAEFGDTYPAVASGRLLDQYEANRRRITCEG